ncbi:efflux RND transporter periplasmic adaptor subunit [bacterium]|nr:efflux RND transporter periplasmic adaptor subunit [bacterium]MBU1958047.1 efflux RND transporter periplasmic adaptor subunit [bacterium]
MQNKERSSKESIEQTLASAKKKSSFWKYLVFLVILLAIGAFFFLQPNEGKNQIGYKTVNPEKKDLISTVSATGNLEPTNSIDIGIEVSGTMEEVLVNYNDEVHKGEVLARLETTKLKSKVNSAKASLEVAQANLEQSLVSRSDAKRELDRVQKLFKSTGGNYPSRKEVDGAKVLYRKSQAAYKASLAQVNQAKASLKLSEDDLTKAVVISPIDGIVLDKAIEAGQSVVAAMSIPTLFTLAKDLKQMEVVVSVDEADVGQVKNGQKVNFTVDAYPNKRFEGVINQVRMNSQIVNGVVTYETVVTVDNSELLLRPGMTVSADITTKVVKDALLVPNAALRFTPTVKQEATKRSFVLFGPRGMKKKSDLSMSGKQLWVLEQGKAKAIEVDFGESDGLNTIVLSDAITTDMKVIISEENAQ